MTSLRLFGIDDAATVERASSSHLFDIVARNQRYRAIGWPYATSAVLHSVAIISIVFLVRQLSPVPLPTPSSHNRTLAHTFVFTGVGRSNRPRAAHRTHSDVVPIAIAGDVAPSPLPPARGDIRAPEPPVVDEKAPQPAFDPPVPVGESRLTARRGDPTEAGLGSATAPTVRGLPNGEVRPGGLGDGNVRNVGTGLPSFEVRPGIDDDGGGGGGGSPPRIQEPLPVPDYPPAARARRLQGIVVLEVMLDSLGKAHVRGVLSDPLGFGIEEAARSAAEKLKFTPARQGGRFVDAIVQVRVTFTLTGSATAVTGGA